MKLKKKNSSNFSLNHFEKKKKVKILKHKSRGWRKGEYIYLLFVFTFIFSTSLDTLK